MTTFERRMLLLGIAFLFIAFSILATSGYQLSIPTALAAPSSDSSQNTSNPVYYGADLSIGGGMEKATGVRASSLSSRPYNAPWPQYSDNYCFLAVVQALTNYEYWKSNHSAPMHFPTQSSQGPADGIPEHATSSQILYQMDTTMVPSQSGVPGSLSVQNPGTNYRTPFTLANIAYDFGGDPRAQAYATYVETPGSHYYHQYIYHNGVNGASLGLAKAVATYHADGYSPAIALVNQGLHSVVVAGVTSYGNPATTSNPTIVSFSVYNPWDQSWGAYLNGAYYETVSYGHWTAGASNLHGYAYWWKLPYNSNHGADPDPNISIYQAGPGTANPNAHHWINSYVTIQRDEDSKDSANYTINEKGQVMYGP